MTHRGTPLRWLLAGAVAAALLFGAGAAYQHHTRTQSARLAGDVGDPPRNRCETAGRYQTVCHTVTVAGVTYRYALVHGTPNQKQATVLDVGGPGASVFGNAWPTGILPYLARQNVILLDEPWVLRPYPRPCAAAVTAWYRTLRTAWTGRPGSPVYRDLDAPGGTIRRACDLFRGKWGWTPVQYRQVLAAVEKQTRLHVNKFVGYSFGSQRAHYLGPDPALTVTLLSPFPYGTDADTYLAAREANLPPAVAVSPPTGRAVQGRSLPVTAFDVAAAQVEGQYLDRTTWEHLTTGPDTALNLGRLSDMLFGRYGTDTLSPALLAYWDETCPALTGWGQGPSLSHATLLGAFTGVCRTPHLPQTVTTMHDAASPACVVQASADSVVPGRLLDRWLSARGWPHARTGPGPHAAPSLLGQCRH